MPHTNRKTNVPPAWRPATFVSVTLTDEDRAAIKAAPNSFESVDDTLIALITDGYKFTLKLDAYNQCFACYMAAPEKSANQNCILTGRGSSPLRAVKQAVYMHRVVLDGDWPDVNEPKRASFDD